MIVLLACCGWFAGIVAAARISPDPALYASIGAFSLLTLIVWRSRSGLRSVEIIGVAFALGAARLISTQPPITPDNLAHYNDQSAVILSGTVENEPITRDSGTSYSTIIRFCSTRLDRPDSTTLPISGCALITLPRSSTELHTGDQLTIRGEPRAPRTIDTFDYGAYLARSGIHSTLYAPTILEHTPGTGSLIGSGLAFREATAARIRTLLPSPIADLLVGVVLGDDTGLPRADKDAFQRAGTAHLLAISGSNIAALTAVVLGITRYATILLRIRRRWALPLAALLMLAYAVFAGGSASVVRAALVGFLSMAALYSGRRGDALTSLGISVFVLTLLNPAALFDLSLLLSAAASLGLILFSEPVTRWLTGRFTRLDTLPDDLSYRERKQRSTERRLQAGQFAGWIVSLALATIFAQVMTLPLIGVATGLDFLKVLFLNILVAPVQPLIITLGLSVAVLAGLVPFLAGIIAAVVSLPLQFTLSLTRVFAANISADSLELSAPAATVYYGLILSTVYVLTLTPQRRRSIWTWLRERSGTLFVQARTAIVLGCIAICIIGAQTLTSIHDGSLLVHVLPTDQIGTLLIRTPNDTLILINAGNMPRQMEAAIGEALPFQRVPDLVIGRLDPLVNAALPHIIDRYRIPETVIPLPDDSTLDDYPNPLLDTLRANPATALRPIYIGESIEDGTTSITWRSIAESGFTTLEHGAFRMLVFPPMRGADMRELLGSADDLSAQIIILTLTDSAVSSVEELLIRIDPQIVFFVQSPGTDSAVATNAAQSILTRLNASRAQPMLIYDVTPSDGYTVRAYGDTLTITDR